MSKSTPAERLKIARKSGGFLSAKKFAALCDIPQSTYALHESGLRNLNIAAAEKYAQLLKVKKNWLLFGSGAASNIIDEKNIRKYLTEEEYEIYCGMHEQDVDTHSESSHYIHHPKVDPDLLKKLMMTLLNSNKLNTLEFSLEELVDTCVSIYTTILTSTHKKEEREKLLDLSLSFLKSKKKSENIKKIAK